MKIAVTADLHLTTREDHPERYRALEDILSQVRQDQVGIVILAGDLFDKTLHSYSEFESLCSRPENREIAFHIIPGNHDAGISGSAIASENVHIITQPQLIPLDAGTAEFLFIPYLEGKTMGECIVPFLDQLPSRNWVLIGHGDWSGVIKEANPYEPGVYMPLTNRDLDMFQPHRAILGHIHKPSDREPVHYVGSPCGLDITETGQRRFLVYDTDSGDIQSKFVNTDLIYFNEHFVVVPMEDEQAFIERMVQSRIESGELKDHEHTKVQVRVKVSGYSSDRTVLKDAVKRAFNGYVFYNDEEPDISSVSLSDDVERQHIADQAKASIEELQWPEGADEPDKNQILLDALRVIYGG